MLKPQNNMEYDFLNDVFTVYKEADSPKVTLDMPLFESPLDISDWAVGISSNGTPIVQNNLKGTKFDIFNTEEQELPVSEEPQETSQFTEEQEYAINRDIKGNKKIAMDFFISKGLKSYQAAAIVGNLLTESGLRTDILGDNNRSIGIAQWNGSRRKNLENFSKKRGTSMLDLNTQLEFLWHELKNDKKSSQDALDKLLKSKSIEEATTVFMRRFERPSIPHLKNRINNAKLLLS